MEKVAAITNGSTLEKGTSLWMDAWHRLIRNKAAFGSGIYLLILILLAILTPWITSFEYDAINYELIGHGPDSVNWFGADNLGRDLYTRCLHGMRVSLAIGVIATAVSFVIGVSYGAISGYFGGRTDNIMMRFVDVLWGLPFMFFVIILMTIFGRNVINLFIALGAVQWLTMSRIVRGQVLSLKHREFVEAARSIGLPARTIIWRHIIPNTIGPVIVYVTLTVPRIILEEAFLSFIGLGVQAPMASLGNLAAEGAEAMEVYPWMLIFPALILASLLFSFNYLGDGLRDALDPKLKSN